MSIESIVAEIDKDIARLETVKRLLVGTPKPVAVEAPTVTHKRKKKRNLSAAGRAAISAAVKRRWALQKKAARA